MDDRIISGYAAVIERLTISDIVPCRFVISNLRPQFLDVRLFEKIRLKDPPEGKGKFVWVSSGNVL